MTSTNSPAAEADASRAGRNPTAPPGLLIVDKPAGWTSHDVVGRLRRLAGTRRVGHAGTLDPMATGVLVIGVEKATRLLTYVVGADKQYTATIRLGIGTTTDDAEGEITSAPGFCLADRRDDIAAALAGLTGEIRQVPSSVSAIKVDGKRAYARVRGGEEVRLTARPVTVSQFDVLEVRPRTVPVGEGAEVPIVDLDVVVTVSSGTYVRALARDLGAALGTAGHLTALRRTRVGGYTLAEARTLEELAAQVERDGVLATIPLVEAAGAYLPMRQVTAEETRELGFGRWIAPTGTPGVHAAICPPSSPGGAPELIALLEDTRRGGEALAKPVLVMASATVG
ncbi:MAG: tRNA pseudouridine(55) synthase TruB [Promicromonosporaceae bacterium]|nr:tRNA pseudouridine(55) synthase TruB [Promicromonosporaceae bacterium]